jgi:hypothetical protein
MKRHTSCKSNAKTKREDKRKQTINVRIYPIISVTIEPSLVYVGEALIKNIAPGHQVSSGTFLNLPQRLDHYGTHQVPGHLDTAFH